MLSLIFHYASEHIHSILYLKQLSIWFALLLRTHLGQHVLMVQETVPPLSTNKIQGICRSLSAYWNSCLHFAQEICKWVHLAQSKMRTVNEPYLDVWSSTWFVYGKIHNWYLVCDVLGDVALLEWDFDMKVFFGLVALHLHVSIFLFCFKTLAETDSFFFWKMYWHVVY